MMSREQVIKNLGLLLRAHGFEGKGRHLHLIWPEVAWLLEIDVVPRTARLGIILGVCPKALAPDGWPTRGNNCPIVFDPDSGGEPFGIDRWEAWQALDADSELVDEDRVELLHGMAKAIAGVAQRVTTLADLRVMAADGHLRGFVHKDARALLQAKGDQPPPPVGG